MNDIALIVQAAAFAAERHRDRRCKDVLGAAASDAQAIPLRVDCLEAYRQLFADVRPLRQWSMLNEGAASCRRGRIRS